jgi:hypothetical protein
MWEGPDITGAKDVLDWFGYWPTFHDAEVVSVSLDRVRGCSVSIHAFQTTPEVDARGHYVTTKHAIVTFWLEGFPRNASGISRIRIEYFNQQNVLSSASVNRLPEGYELRLEGCYGVDGSIVCERMSVTLEPGIPENSIYQPSEQ